MQLQREKDAEAKKAQGTEFYKKKDFVKALELYTEAVNLNPAELIYYSNVAAVHIETKNYAEAIKSCEQG
jgi:tetratricopeptide (TPR) repeat protein